jgi:hypothetical protein
MEFGSWGVRNRPPRTTFAFRSPLLTPLLKTCRVHVLLWTRGSNQKLGEFISFQSCQYITGIFRVAAEGAVARSAAQPRNEVAERAPSPGRWVVRPDATQEGELETVNRTRMPCCAAAPTMAS